MIILASREAGVGMAAAKAALQSGRPVLDVVEAGIHPVEADPTVRSVGVGGWPDLRGDVALDASIMDGDLNTGAVGAMLGYPHPIIICPNPPRTTYKGGIESK